MSTAVIISGHMRTFRQCLPTLRWHILRHYPDAAFFVSTIKDEQSADAELLREWFPAAQVEIEVLAAQPVLPEPFEQIRFEPYARSVPLQAVLRQLWQLEQAWALYKRSRRDDAHTFIRVRPDLYFHSGLDQKITPDADHACVPWWGSFGGINDRFAIMGRVAAINYFHAYGNISGEEKCPLHPESLVMAALHRGGCKISRKLPILFSTARLDGTTRPPEIMPWDIAHAAL
jgi:hypothetical protein